MTVKKLSKILVVTGLAISMPLNIAFAEDVVDMVGDENSTVMQSVANDEMEDVIVCDDYQVVELDLNEQEEDLLQEERVTTVLWSETVIKNSGIDGLTKFLTPTWGLNENVKVTFNITNGGDTPVLFSVLSGTTGGSLGTVTIPVSGSRSLTINGSDIPKTVSQGTYYANITVRAVNANYENAGIKFHVTANLIKN